MEVQLRVGEKSQQKLVGVCECFVYVHCKAIGAERKREQVNLQTQTK